MRQRVLGRSGLQVSELGFGGAPLGNLYSVIDNAEAIATVEQAYAQGVRYFDTAPLYGHGLSERRIGIALGGVERNSYLLSSKVGRLLSPVPRETKVDAGLYINPPPFVADYDYSYDGAWRSVEQSLQRLGSNYLDIVFIHDLDRWTHGERQGAIYQAAMQGAHRALVEMREQGLVRAIGLGVNEWEVCADCLRDGDPDVFLLAGRYTLLEQAALQTFLPQCETREVSIVLGGPYNTGILATGNIEQAYYNYAPANDDVRARVAAIEVVCNEYNVTLAAAALRFPLAHPAVSCVIPGARSVDEVRRNSELINEKIPAAFWLALRDQGLIAENAPIPGESDDC